MTHANKQSAQLEKVNVSTVFHWNLSSCLLLTLMGLLPPSGRLGAAAEMTCFSIDNLFVHSCTERVTVCLVSCCSWGITFQVCELSLRARQRVSSPAWQCCAAPRVRRSGEKGHPAAVAILLQDHFGKYLIFSKNLIFLNTGRTFCLQLLQHTMGMNVSCSVNLCYLCVCRWGETSWKMCCCISIGLPFEGGFSISDRSLMLSWAN